MHICLLTEKVVVARTDVGRVMSAVGDPFPRRMHGKPKANLTFHATADLEERNNYHNIARGTRKSSHTRMNCRCLTLSSHKMG